MARNRESKVKTGGGKLGAFFLGLLMGIIIIVGALTGVGFFVYKQPVKKTVNLIDSSGALYDKLFDAENGYLNEKYANETVGTLLKDGLAAIASLSNGGSLAGLNNITPKTGKTVDKVLATTDKYGIPIDKETLMSKPLGEVSSYVEGQVKETPLGSILKGTTGKEITDPVIKTICYGPTTHYIEINGTIIMNPVGYICIHKTDEDGNLIKLFYDIDYNAVQATYDEGAKTLTFEDETKLYLAQALPSAWIENLPSDWAESLPPEWIGSLPADWTLDLTADLTLDLTPAGPLHLPSEWSIDLSPDLTLDSSATKVELYFAYTDTEKTAPVYYEQTKIKDFGSSSNLFNDLSLADALNIHTVNNNHSVMVELAYGTKDKNYSVAEDGTITLINGSRPRTIGDLKEHNKDILNDITLANALNVNGNSHTVLLSLAYGKKGVDYEVTEDADGNKILTVLNPDSARTLGDLSNNGTNLINDVALSDILPEDRNSSMIMYMLYGRKGVHYIINEEDEIEMQQKRIAVYYDAVQNTYTLYNEYGELIETFDTENSDLEHGVYVDAKGVTYFFDPADTSLGTIKTKLANGKSDGTENMAQLYYLFVEEEGTRVPVYYEAATLGSISGKNNSIVTMTTRLTVSEVFDETTVTGNMFLKHVPNETIDSLPSAILNLSVTQVYEKDVYKYDETKGGFLDEESKALEDQNDLSVRVVNPEWWYMLHSPEECKGTGEHAACVNDNSNCIHHYTVSQLGSLVTNMKTNIQQATLSRLNADGMMNLSGTDLTKPINLSIIKNSTIKAEEKEKLLKDLEGVGIDTRDDAPNKAIGDLTVLQAITYLTAVLGAV